MITIIFIMREILLPLPAASQSTTSSFLLDHVHNPDDFPDDLCLDDLCHDLDHVCHVLCHLLDLSLFLALLAQDCIHQPLNRSWIKILNKLKITSTNSLNL